MEEIKIGEYVRTKKGGILKIIAYDISDKYLFAEHGMIKIKNIVKHSFNLIDLIEVGDVINKEEVLNKVVPNDTWEQIYLQTSTNNWLIQDNIKDILTHEEYNRRSYKVEGRVWVI